ncbi:MAG: lytic transglycosylase domain-containing protein [Flavisolibacter sp.]
MNKLLLLATSLISLTLHDFAAATTRNHSNDTTAQQYISNPKDAFRNLFETENLDGMDISRLNPKAIKFVQDYLDSEGARLESMKGWGKRYFDMMDKALVQKGLPKELKYLSVIESELKANARSWVGAVGPWQLMPETARLLGLKVNGRIDERRDFYKSTLAAAKYLSELYDIYNDWLLVIAAYNCGPGNVNTAIKKSGSRDFWTLQYYLPAESRNHVKKFIATHYIMEGEGSIATLSKSEADDMSLEEQAADNSSLASQDITGKFYSFAIVQSLKMNLSEFNSMNPGFDQQLSSTGKYTLRLPADKMDAFRANRTAILDQSIRLMLGTAMN